MHIAFEECCLIPSTSWSSLATQTGVYSVTTVKSNNISVEVWLPEDEKVWDGSVIVSSPMGSEAIPITKLIDALQKTKNSVIV